LLRAGGLVAFPTETVYGLGANALDPQAVARIFAAKGRPAFDPLIVHVDGRAMLARVGERLSPAAERLIARFWPGPLTLVVPKAGEVPALVTAGLPYRNRRQPAHPLAAALIAAAGVPLAAPSANPFGGISPTCAEHVSRGLGAAVDLILDGGPTEYGLESTIVSAAGEELVLLRHGALSLETLQAFAGPIRDATAPSAGATPNAPGQLSSHYAPRTPLRLIDPRLVPPEERRAAGVLAFERSFADYAAVRVLSPRGSLREAAAQLFATLHALDALGLARIDAEPVPEHDLGRAIMDRLRRAAFRA
jgi:L-threonylcarbamoyladenylate synthase